MIDLERENELLRVAMDDLLNSPKGHVPKSAEKYYNSKHGVFARPIILGMLNEQGESDA